MPEEEKKCGSYEVERTGEEIVLQINYENCPYIPSLEDNPICMSQTVDVLIEVGNVTKLIFSQKRDFEYDYDQSQYLVEIAQCQDVCSSGLGSGKLGAR